MTNAERDKILTQLGLDVAGIMKDLKSGEKTFVSKLACETRHAGWAKRVLVVIVIALVTAFVGGSLAAWTNGHADKQGREQLRQAIEDLKEHIRK